MSAETSWSGRRVLVTGAGGFIASHLTERLVRLGATTRALVRYNAEGRRGWLEGTREEDGLEIVQGDITDPEGLREALDDVEVVFHLAALIAIPYSYRAPRSYLRVNAEGTLNVLQASRDAGVKRVVHTSTSEVYGSARRVPISEEHPLHGQSPYSASKIAADKLAEAYHLSFGLPVITVRPFNTFGPRQSARAVIPTIVSQALWCDEVRLGALEPTRDLLFVADTVEGFLAAGASPDGVGETFNLGTGVEISIGDLARRIMARTGREETAIATDPQRLRPPASEVDRLCADASRARARLGWEARHGLDEGLDATIAWIREHPERFRAGLYAT